jgi:hypothetical protein
MSEKAATLNLDKEIAEIKEKLGHEEWITVFSLNEAATFSDTFYCALIPESMCEEVLGDPKWAFQMGDGLPDYVIIYQNGKEEIKYYRFSPDSIEPLAILRRFHGLKHNFWEINEEFRHYFDLYEDKKNGKFIEIDDNGDETEVVVIQKDSIRIRSRFIKDFLALKKMRLLIQYEFNRFSTKTLEEQGIKELHLTEKQGDYCFVQYKHNYDFVYEDIKSHARLFGVKVIQGFAEAAKPRWLEKKNKKYEEFFIGFNEKGEKITFTCDEKRLSNFFGANKEAPNYLTPIIFSKDVLTKYYAQPSKYSVHDGVISCGDLWSLRIDNNNTDYVLVYLGDLGKLENKEQLHWKHHNIETNGKVSHTAWARDFEANFAHPERSDLFFKNRYADVQKNWKDQMGWDLFNPLSTDDEYHFKTLRIPLTKEQKEFDEQVLSLTKLIIDSLNEKEIVKGLAPPKPNSKGITKLNDFLKSKGFYFSEMIKFLRDLQDLRSCGVAHLKGAEYEHMKGAFGIGEKELPNVFDGILIKAIMMLNTIDFQVLGTKPEKYDLQ